MSLPASLLAAVAGHRCFAGRYKGDAATAICVDPTRPLAPAHQASCSECSSFRVGALASMLGSTTTSQRLADELSAYVGTKRGYLWSTSGYSAAGGFWLSAAYYGDGLFLVDGSRNNNPLSDVDVLVSAFRHGVVSPEHPRMLMPSLYTSEVVYVDMSQPITPVREKNDLLSSPRCRSTRTPGFHRVAILEFIPLTRAAAIRRAGAPRPISVHPAAHPSASSPSNATVHTPTPAPASPAVEAEVCPFCGAEIKERPLFTGSYVGCLC